MTMRIKTTLFFVVLALVLAAGCREDRPLKVGDRPEALSPEVLQGGRIAIPTDYPNQVVMLRFWMDTCPACAIEMPQLDALYRKYRDRGFVIIAVNVGQPRERVSRFVQQHALTYPVALDPLSLMNKYYGVVGYPTTYLIDRTGIVRKKIVGSAKPDAYETAIREILQ